MASEPVAVGIVGCGHVSDQYLHGMALFDVLRLHACADLDEARASRKAAEHGIEKVCSPEYALGPEEFTALTAT